MVIFVNQRSFLLSLIFMIKMVILPRLIGNFLKFGDNLQNDVQ